MLCYVFAKVIKKGDNVGVATKKASAPKEQTPLFRFLASILELGTCCNESLTCLIACVLGEVLDETTCQIHSLLLPLCCISISVAGVKDSGINTGQRCRNNEVEVRNNLCGSCID